MTNLTEAEALRYHAHRNDPFYGCVLTFVTEAIPNEEKTLKEGRPIYDEIEILEVKVPGGRVQPIPVTDEIRKKYKDKYDAFKAGREQPETGTPLREWSMMPASVLKEFLHFGVRTVEQVAELNDAQKQQLGTLYLWVEKAKKWLASANTKQARVVALEEQVATLEARLKKYEEQVTLLSMRNNALEGHTVPAS